MTTWSDVGVGDRVVMKGREYTVTKAKPKGKKVKVRLSGPGGTFDGVVRSGDDVQLPALHDGGGRTTRWATKAEEVRPMQAGDPDLAAPPRKPGADPWMSRRDRVEERLDDMLGAHLVGEATDEGQGYYVPPVDVSTVDAHLMLFHGLAPSDWGADADRVALHERAHADAANMPPKVTHWHTATRPVVR